MKKEKKAIKFLSYIRVLLFCLISNYFILYFILFFFHHRPVQNTMENDNKITTSGEKDKERERERERERKTKYKQRVYDSKEK